MFHPVQAESQSISIEPLTKKSLIHFIKPNKPTNQPLQVEAHRKLLKTAKEKTQMKVTHIVGRMWSPALELSDIDEAVAEADEDDSKLAMLDAEADVVLEAIQLNMLSATEETQMG